MKLRKGKIKRTSAVDKSTIESWTPKTILGKEVKEGKITSLKEILEGGRGIFESEIIDVLVPDLKHEMLELSSTQRMTDSGRKAKYRAVVIVGDEKNFVGIGQGKADEVKPAVETALKDAKLSLIPVTLGCGSWECGCGSPHSLPITVVGIYGGVKVVLKPAPRGTGIVANQTIRKVLQLAGIKDVWTRAEGRTRNRLNSASAVINALDQLNSIRVKREKIERSEK